MRKIDPKERKKLDRFHEDSDGGGWLYINLYFTDGTNFSMDFSINEPAIVPRVIEYGDMSSGDYENIRTYYYRRENQRGRAR